MAENILRLRVESEEYDNKIKHAREGLQALEQSLRGAGKTFMDADEDAIAFTRALGKMDTVSKNTKGKIGELSSAFVELSHQYNKLTEAEKQSPYGRAISQSLAELKDRTIEAKRELESLNKELQDVKTPEVGGGFLSGDKMSGMLQVFGGNLLTKAAGMFANLASEMGDIVKQGIEMAKQGEGIRIAFERLGRGDILDGLREATHGTVEDIELMQAAVKFNDFKLPVEELGTMLAFAQQKAKDTGQSVDYMVDSMVTGLGRKSLMILDNLGLSASEVKEKMKQTGDMTKAVGEIIREQMGKAGGYIETAADRATAANVRLKNAMSELGNTLTPLSNDFGNFWNELKIGGLNFLNEVLGPIVSKMTQAGQIASAKNRLGGSEEVNNQLAALSGSSTKQMTMLSQLAKYDQQIKDLQTAADKVVVPAAGQGSQYAITQINAYKTQIQALLQMREDYQKRAMEIIAPKATSTATSPTTGGTGNKATTKLKEEYVPLVGSIDYMQQQLRSLQSEFDKTADESVRGKLLPEIEKVKLIIDAMNDGLSMTLDRASGGSLTEQMGLGFDKNSLGKVELKPAETPERRQEMNMMQRYDKAVGGFSSIAGGMKQLGIELPKGLETLLGGLQGLSTIVSGVTSVIEAFSVGSQAANTVALTANTVALGALTSAVATNTAFSFIPFFANGGVVHAAGGLNVPGNHFSGDMVPALVNSGETILTMAQSAIVAEALSQRSMGASPTSSVLRGEEIIFAVNNTLRRMGMGEMATTRGRR